MWVWPACPSGRDADPYWDWDGLRILCRCDLSPTARDGAGRRARILAYIQSYTDQYGYAPSYREIATGAGLASPASAARHIKVLVAAGVLTHIPSFPRTLRVVSQ